MAVCPDCELEMNDLKTTTCEGNEWVKYADDTVLKRIPYNNEFFTGLQDEADHRCHDCGVALGGIHHYGCDMEECPRCKDQLAFCDCGGVLRGNNR